MCIETLFCAIEYKKLTISNFGRFVRQILFAPPVLKLVYTPVQCGSNVARESGLDKFSVAEGIDWSHNYLRILHLALHI